MIEGVFSLKKNIASFSQRFSSDKDREQKINRETSQSRFTAVKKIVVVVVVAPKITYAQTKLPQCCIKVPRIDRCTQTLE